MALFLGLLSGTSCDAIDAALVDLEAAPRLQAYAQYPVDPDLAQRLRAAAGATLAEVGALDRELGILFGEAALRLLREAAVDGAQVRAIGSHGQTAYHHGEAPVFSCQIGDPARIAALTGITTVADFRRMDIAVGGHGAPLAAALHQVLFRHHQVDRVIVNLGGIANLTFLPAQQDLPVTGFDSGPANTLLDAWARRHLATPFDRDGDWARSGKAHQGLLQHLLDDAYFEHAAPKSTGPERFNLQRLDAVLLGRQISPADVQATLVELTAASVARAVLDAKPRPGEVYLCGGGVHNACLVDALRRRMPEQKVQSTEAMGLPADAVEAVLFAWLARRRLDSRPGNVPTVTGATREVVLGAVYDPR